MSDIGHALNDLEALRLDMLERTTLLLQNQSLSRNFAAKLYDLIDREHGQIIGQLDALVSDPAAHAQLPSEIAEQCGRLRKTVNLLLENWNRHGDQSNRATRHLIHHFSTASDQLSETIIDRDLFDRQSQVLEQIILSHEHVAYWKEFVQKILIDFHHLFPFQFFFIAFAEENGLSLYIYYMGSYSDATKERVRRSLSQKMLADLSFSSDTPLDIEEFEVLKESSDVNDEAVSMLTVKVPEYAPKLAGLLGAAYASMNTYSRKEEAVIRSILSVMVMVVGSSKVLSKTISELEYYSVHDPLTGLYNRRHFNEMLEHEIGRSERHRHEFSIVFIDCDNFKEINDSFGHPTGDEVLTEMAAIMNALMRKGDLVARFGGDEFAIMLPETGRDGALIVAEQVRKAIHDTVFKNPAGESFHASVSLGAVSYPNDAVSVPDLMAGCDMALYKAKFAGKNSVIAFDGKHSAEKARTERMAIETLRNAIRDDRIVPYFQPIFDCAKNEIFAYDVVARMLSESGEVVPAAAFIESVERYGLARELDMAIVQNTFRAMRGQLDAGKTLKPVFINLSAQEIQGRGILEYAEERCHAMQIPCNMVVFELTEREAISDMGSMRRFLSQLQQRGFKFALDDFGSGYNSFHYLRELRFDFVKIDGEFVRSMQHSRIDKALVSNLSRLCQELSIRTVAEYVENEEIYDLIRSEGVDFGQGYYLGMPGAQLEG